MRLLQFKPRNDPNARPRVGALIASGRAILDLPATLDGAGRGGWLPAASSTEWWNLEGSVWSLVRSSVEAAQRATEKTVEQWRRTGKVVAIEEAVLLPPIPRPGKLICVGLNYRDHAEEQGASVPERPLLFSKFSTCVIGTESEVVLPSTSAEVDYEAELAVVIGRLAKNVTKERAFDHVFGYCAFNDVTARDFQRSDKQWQRAKSCDTFAPLGPFVATPDEIPNPQNLAIKLRLNGETMQNSRTDQLIFGVADLIEFITQTTTLEPGDVIATGTPGGVGFARKPPLFLKPGDRMEVEIEGLGVLVNSIVASP